MFLVKHPLPNSQPSMFPVVFTWPVLGLLFAIPGSIAQPPRLFLLWWPIIISEVTEPMILTIILLTPTSYRCKMSTFCFWITVETVWKISWHLLKSCHPELSQLKTENCTFNLSELYLKKPHHPDSFLPVSCRQMDGQVKLIQECLFAKGHLMEDG